jgi:uncharacterized membrane protein YbhN (UPF0104 family)
MSITAESLALFIFLLVLFYFKFPDITNNNYIFHKLIIFIATFVFKFVIELYKKIKEDEKIDAMDILNNSVHYSLYNIIGYSLYIDLMYMNRPFDSLRIDIANNDNHRFLISSFITSLFVFLIEIAKDLFSKKM